jgi:hypothetical protein
MAQIVPTSQLVGTRMQSTQIGPNCRRPRWTPLRLTVNGPSSLLGAQILPFGYPVSWTDRFRFLYLQRMVFFQEKRKLTQRNGMTWNGFMNGSGPLIAAQTVLIDFSLQSAKLLQGRISTRSGGAVEMQRNVGF